LNVAQNVSRLAEADRERIRGGGFFGLSLLIVAAIMSHGHECGCVKAEMLAINDDGAAWRNWLLSFIAKHSSLLVFL